MTRLARTGATALALAALALPGTVLAAPSAAASPSAPSAPTEDRAVTELEPNIVALERNIEPLETVTTEGDETAITLNTDVLFAFGSSELGDGADGKIAELVEDIPDGGTVRVVGHTDDIPYERGNDVLSLERAQAVADVITEARGDLELEVEGLGDTEPVAPNSSGGEDDPEGRAENRRVEIRYDG